MQETLACIVLGSNQGDREQYIQTAIETMSKIPGCQLDLSSRYYETPPWGLEDQPSFLNAACGLLCTIPPRDLLSALQDIEKAGGRERIQKWGPRTLDIDIISYGRIQMDTPELKLPHPLFKQRRFVLEPLAEIYPEVVVDNLSILEHFRDLDT